MAVVFINTPKAVEVERADGDAVPAAFRSPDELLQALLKKQPVRQAGQAIMLGLADQFRLQVTMFDGDLGEVTYTAKSTHALRQPSQGQAPREERRRRAMVRRTRRATMKKSDHANGVSVRGEHGKGKTPMRWSRKGLDEVRAVGGGCCHP